MKKSIFTSMICLLVSIAGFAQVKKVITDVYGTFEVVVEVGEDAFVTISSEGKVLDTEINGSFSYYGSGKISRIGSTDFSYYGSGRVSRVGSIDFSYYESGRISRIGSTDFSYYGSGRVSRVGSIDFSYYESGRISRIGSTDFSYYGSGKLSSGNTSFIHNGISFRVTGGN